LFTASIVGLVSEAAIAGTTAIANPRRAPERMPRVCQLTIWFHLSSLTAADRRLGRALIERERCAS
jgi:hypothetical protein